MKKLYYFISAFLMLITSCILIGCNDSTVKIESITAKNIETNILVGYELNFNNLEIELNYDNGESTTIKYLEHKNEIKIDSTQLDTTIAGEYIIKISYTENDIEVETTLTIKVSDVALTELKEVNGVKTKLYLGEDFDYSNMSLKLGFEDNIDRTITYQGHTNDITINDSAINKDVEGEYDVIISYTLKGITKEKTIVVEYEYDDITKIEVSNLSSLTTNHYIGEDFDYSNLKVKVTYESKKETIINFNQSSDIIIDSSKLDKTTPGEYDFIIKYSENQIEKTTIIKVTYRYKTIKNMSIKNPSAVETILLAGSTFDKNSIKDLILEITYIDDTTVDYACKDDLLRIEVDTANINFETPGNYNVYIKYEENESVTKTITLGIQIYNNADGYEISGFEPPYFVTSYEGITSQNYNYLDKNIESYKVGTNNAFVFMPMVSGTNKRGETKSISSYISSVKLEIKETNNNQTTYTDVSLVRTGNNLTSNYMNGNNSTQEFNFTEKAIGKTFKLTVSPMGDTDRRHKFSFEFEVIDGYNIYTTKELSVITNGSKDGNNWKKFKEDNNIPTNIRITTAIIHGDKILSDSDFPKNHFYQNASEVNANISNQEKSKAIGSLKPWTTLYERTVAANYGTEFKLYGNYFTINATAVSKTSLSVIKKYINNKGEEKPREDSHSFLFGFNSCDNINSDQLFEKNTKVLIENITLIGNSQKSSSNTDVDDRQGGLEAVITGTETAIFNNVNINAFFLLNTATTINEVWENSAVTYNKCYFHDSFSNMVYSYGVRNFYVNDSIFEDAGGPMFMICHKDPRTQQNIRYGNITIKDSTITSSLIGTEIWFTMYGAVPIATQLKTLNNLIKAYTNNTRSILLNENNFELFNFMVVLMDANNPLTSDGLVKGSATIIDSNKDIQDKDLVMFIEKYEFVAEDENNESNEDNETNDETETPKTLTFGSMVSKLIELFTAPTSIFQSSAGGMYYVYATDVNNTDTYTLVNFYTSVLNGIIDGLNSNAATINGLLTSIGSQQSLPSLSSAANKREETATNIEAYIQIFSTIIDAANKQQITLEETQLEMLNAALEKSILVKYFLPYEKDNAANFAKGEYMYILSPAGESKIGVVTKYFTI